MFNERKVICVHLFLFLFLPIINMSKDRGIMKQWIICSVLLFIFPFLPTKLKDNLILM